MRSSFYEFISHIVDYDDQNLEKLSLFARHLRPLLHEQCIEENEIDFSNVEMSHYRLPKLRKQHLTLQENAAKYKITPGNAVGTAKPKDQKQAFLSNILARLNALFIIDNLTDKDMINYAFTVRDKLSENQAVMTQIANNTREQAMLGDFPKATHDAVMDSSDAWQEMMCNTFLTLNWRKVLRAWCLIC